MMNSFYATQRAMSRRLIDEHERDPFSYQQQEWNTYMQTHYSLL